jgi:hypothetical protein
MLNSLRGARAPRQKSEAPQAVASKTPNVDAIVEDRREIDRTKTFVDMRCWQVTANDWRVQRMPRWTIYYRHRPRRPPRRRNARAARRAANRSRRGS